MKNVFYFLLLTSFIGNTQELIIPLYTDEIPCSSKKKNNSIINTSPTNQKIKNPQLWYYKAPNSKNKVPAILVIPGGGYKNLAFEHEGTKVAQWLNKNGVSAFVLMYRTPHWESEPCKNKVALLDAQRALYILNTNAKQWNINASKIGVMGFSAGGHLSATISNHFDFNFFKKNINKENFRPSFCILIYPVISMRDKYTNEGTKFSLLGNSPTEKQVEFFSNELQVRGKTPPTLLIHAKDDSIVDPENSIRYHKALQENKIPTRLHLMEQGGHGFGIKNALEPTNFWLKITKEWLKQQKIIAY